MKAYLDNAATTMVIPAAAQAAMEAMTDAFGNPSSLHEEGRRAREILDKSREEIALSLGCQAKNLYFTSGGTEGINTSIMGAAAKNRHLGRHIISTAIEHDAVLNALNDLKNSGFEITLIRPRRDGLINPDEVLSAVREDTILISMQGINNETGAILPYQQVASQYKKSHPGGLFHLDGVQNFLKRPMPLENVDLASISAHKIGGMKGCGALYVRPGLKIKPLLFGGGQEAGMRSGTEGLPQIAAFAAAAANRRANMVSNAEHMARLKSYLIDNIRAMGGEINTPESSADHIVNLSLCRGRSEVYIRILSDMGVYVSGGSACARGKSSHVLAAMGLPKKNIDAALRVSLCPENSMEHIDALLEGLRSAVKMFR